MKTKRIISIVLITIVALIAGLVITSAFIPKNFNYNLETPDCITIYKDGAQYPLDIEYTNEHFDEIWKRFNQGFNSTVLNSFFQGKLFSGVSSLDSRVNLDNSDLKKANKIYIELRYSTPQQTNLYGQNFSLNQAEKTYNSVVFEVINSNNLTQVKATLRQGLDGATFGYINYISYASHANLYNYINENVEF